jgi:hypothetical protein
MKTLAHERDRAEIARRLTTIRPDARALWGKMSAHQMVCHLSDSFRMALGRKTAKDVGGVMQRTVVKWIALYVPVRWPTELVTVPEVDQQVGGTAPVEFAADLAELSELFESFTNRTREDGAQRPPHPVFGRMSRATWLRWGYLHTDHHLRQFGL